MIRWNVRYADFMGITHPYYTMSEDVAKRHAARIINDLIIPQLEYQSQIWAKIGPTQDNEHAEFVKDARKLVNRLNSDLKAGKIWDAYGKFLEFEEAYQEEFPPLGLHASIGSIRVDPDPTEG